MVSSTSVTNRGGGQSNLEDLSPLDPPPDDLPHLSKSGSQQVSAKCIKPSIPKAETSPSILPSNTHYLWISGFTRKFPLSLSSRLLSFYPKMAPQGQPSAMDRVHAIMADLEKEARASDSNFDSPDPTVSSGKIRGSILSNHCRASSRRNRPKERPPRRVRFGPLPVDTTPKIMQSSPHGHAKSRVRRYVALSSQPHHQRLRLPSC